MPALPPGVALTQVSEPTLALARRAAGEAAAGPREPANGMSAHAFRLRGPSAEHAIRALLAEVVAELPRIAALAPRPRVHAFVVDYGPEADRALDLHVDDAALTVNLCLETNAEGAELELMGVRCRLHRHSPTRPEERVRYEARPGQALLHHGDLRHRVLPLRGGARRSLLLWLKEASSAAPAVAEARCHDACGHAPG